MSPAPLFHLPSALRRLKNNNGGSSGWRSPKRSEGENKAQQMLGISTTDMQIARNQSIASSTSNRSQQPYTEVYPDRRAPRRKEGAANFPEVDTKASSVLLREEFVNAATNAESRQPKPMKNVASSSTLRSYYESQKVPLSISQQTSESSRRDLALRKGNPPAFNSPFSLKENSMANGPPKLSPAGEGRKLSKQRPKTSEESTGRKDELRPATGYESVPSIKSMNKAIRSSRTTSAKPNTNTRRLTGSTNKSLLEPLDPACVKVNVRRPRVGAKHWFDGLEEESSEEEAAVDLELQPHFFSGLETAFQCQQIKPPSARSSVRTDTQTYHLSNSSVATPKQFLRSQSSTEGSPKVAVLNARSSRTSFAQHSTRSQKSATIQRKASTIIATDLSKNSFLNLSGSDDETEDESLPQTAGPVRSPAIDKSPPIRESVVMAFNNDSAVEIGMAHELPATASTIGPQHTRIRRLKVANPAGKPEHIRMPIPRRGSSLALSNLQDQAERQSAEQRQSRDLIPSFPATPTDSDGAAYRMSVSLFSDTASVESRRMMSVSKQEESLLAAMRLKKATMKQNVTRDKRLQALRSLEQGQPKTPPLQLAPPNGELASSYHQRQPVLPQYGEGIGEDSISRASGTTFQTHSTTRQSRIIPDASTQLNRLSLSSDSQSASPSMLSLNTQDRRQSRDTYFSGTSPGVHHSGHSRQRTESSHFSHVVELDKVPDPRDDITSQDFIDWPYRRWHTTMGVAH